MSTTDAHRRRRAPRRRLIPCAALIAVTLWLLLPGVASAHAHLVQADPAPDAVVAHVPTVASFVFDEPLNPALTRVRVTDAAGRQVTVDRGHLAAGHGGEMWQVRLPQLAPGTYSVFWTSESATDGHVMSSFYTFRVAPSGGTARMGAAMGTTNTIDTMGGMTAGSGGAAGGLSVDGNAVAITLCVWLGLIAQALWLGALVVDLAVLAPARRTGSTAEARLAWAATQRLWGLIRYAPIAVGVTLLGEVLSLSMAGTGDEWRQALAPATLGGILSSQNGELILLRLLALVVALRLTTRVSAPAAAPLAVPRSPRLRPARTLGIIAPPAIPFQMEWSSARVPLTVLAAVYMALVALSGHAARVSPVWQSCAIDWLHLVCTAAWAGGMAALAYGVLPLRRRLEPDLRARAILKLLDRFSPVAYASVVILAASGMYSAMSHLDTPAMVSGTWYGRLLLVKSGLVGVLIALSASHVLILRPRIARAQRRIRWDGPALDVARDRALVHEGLAALASRLRLEAWVGAAVLFVTALMSQTLPMASTPQANAAVHPAAAPAITGTATGGDLRGQLTVEQPSVGTTTFALRLWEHGKPLTEDTAAAIIHLFPARQPSMRATLTPVARGARFAARGSLALTGLWRADVLVRTATVNDYRQLTFTFTTSPGARFVASPVVDPAHQARSH